MPNRPAVSARSLPPVAKTPAREATKPLATKVAVMADQKVFATIDGKKQLIGEGGLNAWVLGNGRYVAFSGRDGAGGFEGEGQSLRLFDTQTGKTTKVMAEYAMVDKVNSVKTADGKWGLVVSMSDGGLGGDHLAVVDPTRGQVFRSPMSAALSMTGGKVKVGHFTEANYEDGTRAGKPTRTETLDMAALLVRPVIKNKPTW